MKVLFREVYIFSLLLWCLHPIQCEEDSSSTTENTIDQVVEFLKSMKSVDSHFPSSDSVEDLIVSIPPYSTYIYKGKLFILHRNVPYTEQIDTEDSKYYLNIFGVDNPNIEVINPDDWSKQNLQLQMYKDGTIFPFSDLINYKKNPRVYKIISETYSKFYSTPRIPNRKFISDETKEKVNLHIDSYQNFINALHILYHNDSTTFKFINGITIQDWITLLKEGYKYLHFRLESFFLLKGLGLSVHHFTLDEFIIDRVLNDIIAVQSANFKKLGTFKNVIDSANLLKGVDKVTMEMIETAVRNYLASNGLRTINILFLNDFFLRKELVDITENDIVDFVNEVIEMSEVDVPSRPVVSILKYLMELMNFHFLPNPPTLSEVDSSLAWEESHSTCLIRSIYAEFISQFFKNVVTSTQANSPQKGSVFSTLTNLMYNIFKGNKAPNQLPDSESAETTIALVSDGEDPSIWVRTTTVDKQFPWIIQMRKEFSSIKTGIILNTQLQLFRVSVAEIYKQRNKKPSFQKITKAIPDNTNPKVKTIENFFNELIALLELHNGDSTTKPNPNPDPSTITDSSASPTLSAASIDEEILEEKKAQKVNAAIRSYSSTNSSKAEKAQSNKKKRILFEDIDKDDKIEESPSIKEIPQIKKKKQIREDYVKQELENWGEKEASQLLNSMNEWLKRELENEDEGSDNVQNKEEDEDDDDDTNESILSEDYNEKLTEINDSDFEMNMNISNKSESEEETEEESEEYPEEEPEEDLEEEPEEDLEEEPEEDLEEEPQEESEENPEEPEEDLEEELQEESEENPEEEPEEDPEEEPQEESEEEPQEESEEESGKLDFEKKLSEKILPEETITHISKIFGIGNANLHVPELFIDSNEQLPNQGEQENSGYAAESLQGIITMDATFTISENRSIKNSNQKQDNNNKMISNLKWGDYLITSEPMDQNSQKPKKSDTVKHDCFYAYANKLISRDMDFVSMDKIKSQDENKEPELFDKYKIKEENVGNQELQHEKTEYMEYQVEPKPNNTKENNNIINDEEDTYKKTNSLLDISLQEVSETPKINIRGRNSRVLLELPAAVVAGIEGEPEEYDDEKFYGIKLKEHTQYSLDNADYPINVKPFDQFTEEEKAVVEKEMGVIEGLLKQDAQDEKEKIKACLDDVDESFDDYYRKTKYVHEWPSYFPDEASATYPTEDEMRIIVDSAVVSTTSYSLFFFKQNERQYKLMLSYISYNAIKRDIYKDALNAVYDSRMTFLQDIDDLEKAKIKEFNEVFDLLSDKVKNMKGIENVESFDQEIKQLIKRIKKKEQAKYARLDVDFEKIAKAHKEQASIDMDGFLRTEYREWITRRKLESYELIRTSYNQSIDVIEDKHGPHDMQYKKILYNEYLKLFFQINKDFEAETKDVMHKLIVHYQSVKKVYNAYVHRSIEAKQNIIKKHITQKLQELVREIEKVAGVEGQLEIDRVNAQKLLVIEKITLLKKRITDIQAQIKKLEDKFSRLGNRNTPEAQRKKDDMQQLIETFKKKVAGTYDELHRYETELETVMVEQEQITSKTDKIGGYETEILELQFNLDKCRYDHFLNDVLIHDTDLYSLTYKSVEEYLKQAELTLERDVESEEQLLAEVAGLDKQIQQEELALLDLKEKSENGPEQETAKLNYAAKIKLIGELKIQKDELQKQTALLEIKIERLNKIIDYLVKTPPPFTLPLEPPNCTITHPRNVPKEIPSDPKKTIPPGTVDPSEGSVTVLPTEDDKVPPVALPDEIKGEITIVIPPKKVNGPTVVITPKDGPTIVIPHKKDLPDSTIPPVDDPGKKDPPHVIDGEPVTVTPPPVDDNLSIGEIIVALPCDRDNPIVVPDLPGDKIISKDITPPGKYEIIPLSKLTTFEAVVKEQIKHMGILNDAKQSLYMKINLNEGDFEGSLKNVDFRIEKYLNQRYTTAEKLNVHLRKSHNQFLRKIKSFQFHFENYLVLRKGSVNLTEDAKTLGYLLRNSENLKNFINKLEMHTVKDYTIFILNPTKFTTEITNKQPKLEEDYKALLKMYESLVAHAKSINKMLANLHEGRERYHLDLADIVSFMGIQKLYMDATAFIYRNSYKDHGLTTRERNTLFSKKIQQHSKGPVVIKIGQFMWNDRMGTIPAGDDLLKPGNIQILKEIKDLQVIKELLDKKLNKAFLLDDPKLHTYIRMFNIIEQKKPHLYLFTPDEMYHMDFKGKVKTQPPIGNFMNLLKNIKKEHPNWELYIKEDRIKEIVDSFDNFIKHYNISYDQIIEGIKFLQKNPKLISLKDLVDLSYSILGYTDLHLITPETLLFYLCTSLELLQVEVDMIDLKEKNLKLDDPIYLSFFQNYHFERENIKEKIKKYVSYFLYYEDTSVHFSYDVRLKEFLIALNAALDRDNTMMNIFKNKQSTFYKQLTEGIKTAVKDFFYFFVDKTIKEHPLFKNKEEVNKKVGKELRGNLYYAQEVDKIDINEELKSILYFMHPNIREYRFVEEKLNPNIQCLKDFTHFNFKELFFFLDEMDINKEIRNFFKTREFTKTFPLLFFFRIFFEPQFQQYFSKENILLYVKHYFPNTVMDSKTQTHVTVLIYSLVMRLSYLTTSFTKNEIPYLFETADMELMNLFHTVLNKMVFLLFCKDEYTTTEHFNPTNLILNKPFKLDAVILYEKLLNSIPQPIQDTFVDFLDQHAGSVIMNHLLPDLFLLAHNVLNPDDKQTYFETVDEDVAELFFNLRFSPSMSKNLRRSFYDLVSTAIPYIIELPIFTVRKITHQGDLLQYKKKLTLDDDIFDKNSIRILTQKLFHRSFTFSDINKMLISMMKKHKVNFPKLNIFLVEYILKTENVYLKMYQYFFERFHKLAIPPPMYEIFFLITKHLLDYGIYPERIHKSDLEESLLNHLNIKYTRFEYVITHLITCLFEFYNFREVYKCEAIGNFVPEDMSKEDNLLKVLQAPFIDIFYNVNHNWLTQQFARNVSTMEIHLASEILPETVTEMSLGKSTYIQIIRLKYLLFDTMEYIIQQLMKNIPLDMSHQADISEIKTELHLLVNTTFKHFKEANKITVKDPAHMFGSINSFIKEQDEASIELLKTQSQVDYYIASILADRNILAIASPYFLQALSTNKKFFPSLSDVYKFVDKRVTIVNTLYYSEDQLLVSTPFVIRVLLGILKNFGLTIYTEEPSA